MHERGRAADEHEADDGRAIAHAGAEHSRGRRICLCVDDYGLHPGVDAAALVLAALRRVHAIGCMVNGASWSSGAAAMRERGTAAFDAGLHLDLTDRPLRRPRSLPLLIAASHLHLLPRAALRDEIRAQLDAFEGGLGHAPAFVDGHRHVHQLPVVRELLLDELDRRGGAIRPWLRCTAAPHGLVPPDGRTLGERLKPEFVAGLGSRPLAALAKRRGYGHNHRLLGVYGFGDSPARYRAWLGAWLACAVDGDLLMCHPGLPDGSAAGLADPLRRSRPVEMTVLASPAFGQLLQAWLLDPQPMSRILARPAR